MGHEVVAMASSPPPATSWASGFRFHPPDKELVMYYLMWKACGKPFRFHWHECENRKLEASCCCFCCVGETCYVVVGLHQTGNLCVVFCGG
ncbi:unnamed protein product [Ilex paraguariensis]|uniref:NAC domain-containing protein n=1 Tax=Ilex paraguariensis TaxID=185542 RepID=A0ABC8V044_9AQUA